MNKLLKKGHDVMIGKKIAPYGELLKKCKLKGNK